MQMNSSKLLFSSTLIISTILVLSSNSWISMWMGMEINLLSFSAIISKNKNNLSSESCMIYFLIQSMSSIMFLMMIIMNPMYSIMNETHTTTNVIIMSAMAIKMGASPFHFWLPEIMEKMDWTNCTILMTWQKIAPMTIMSQISLIEKSITIIALLSAMTGAIGGMNQTSMRKIMAYSSINHMGWMLIVMKFENEMWMNYLIIYSMIVIMTNFTLNSMSIFYMGQMIPNLTMMEKINYTCMMMSLGGLPPFLGFLPKWMVIQSLLMKNMMFTLTLMIMMTLITLFYYIRMITPMLMINSSINKWMIKSKINNKSTTMITIMNMSLPIIMIIDFF